MSKSRSTSIDHCLNVCAKALRHEHPMSYHFSYLGKRYGKSSLQLFNPLLITPVFRPMKDEGSPRSSHIYQHPRSRHHWGSKLSVWEASWASAQQNFVTRVTGPLRISREPIKQENNSLCTLTIFLIFLIFLIFPIFLSFFLYLSRCFSRAALLKAHCWQKRANMLDMRPMRKPWKR